MAKETSVVAWLAPYVAGIAAAWFAGGLPPAFLAFALPGALISCRSLRTSPLLGAWILWTVPMGLALWSISEGRRDYVAVWAAIALIGGLIFVANVRKSPNVAWPLGLLAVLVGLVAYFSSSRGGANPMIAWWMHHGFTEAQAHSLTLAFRKTVHFSCYGTVGLIALLTARKAKAEPAVAVRTALLAALALASFDELRQSEFSSRSGSPWDVLLDLTGAAVFVGLSEWRRRKAR